MNQIFIVTPFGVKNGTDFGRVERDLIQPAVKAVGFSGGATGEIIKQGNIRTDMFEKLLVAELVIADISIHNANAFYELGARHAFRGASGRRIPADVMEFVPRELRLAPGEQQELRTRATVPAVTAPGRYHGLLVVTEIDDLRALVTIEVA